MTNLIDADIFATKTGSPSPSPRGERSDEGGKAEFAKLLSAPDGEVSDEVALLQGELNATETPPLPATRPTTVLPDVLSGETASTEPALTADQVADVAIPETAIVASEAPILASDEKLAAEAEKAAAPDARHVDPGKLEAASIAPAADNTELEEATNTKVSAAEPEPTKKGDVAAAETKVAAGTTDTPAPAPLERTGTAPTEAQKASATDLAELAANQNEPHIRTATAGNAATASVETPSTPTIQAAPSQLAVTTAAVTSSAPVAAAPPPPSITAAPAEIPAIVAQSLSSVDDHKDRILVQLDPPELGRISIDFKFDAAGLQHVTITGESPEALRQLRQMHFELLQALERQGLSSQDMTFRQNDPGDHPNTELFASDANGDAAEGDRAIETIEAVIKQTSPITNLAGGAGLDIRV